MKKTSIITLLLVGSFALPALAAPPELRAAQALSPSTHLTYLPAVAMDDAGNSTAFWSYSSTSRHGMRYADRRVGEGFAPSYSLESPGSNQIADPAIDISPNGITAATWVDEIDDTTVLLARYRPAGGDWGDYQIVGQGATDQDGYAEPHIAVSDSGRVVIVFIHYLEDGSHNYEAVLSDTSGTFGEAQVIDNRMGTQSVGNHGPNAGIDAVGNAMILWESYDDAETDPRTFVMYALAPSTGDTFAAPATLSEVHQDGVDPRLAVNPSGQVVAIWIQTQESGDSYLNSAIGTTTAGLSGIAPVLGGRPDWIDLAIDEDGNAIAARRGLVDGEVGNDVLQANVLVSGGSWGTAQTLDSNADTDTSLETSDETLDVVATNGTGVVAWGRQDPSGYMPARMAVLDATTHEFGAPELVSGTSAQVDHLRVDMNPQGDAVFVWRDSSRVYARATWDPPAPGNLSIDVARGQRVTASGRLSPANPGAEVSVTLSRKSSGTFRRLASKTVTLDGSSEYNARFSRPRPGTCKVKTVFAGNGVVRRTTASKTFSC